MLAACAPGLGNSRPADTQCSRTTTRSPVQSASALLAARLWMRGLGPRIGLDVPERHAKHDFAHE